MRFSIVIPTVGRPSLTDTLRSITASTGPPPARIVVVDDRPGPARPLDVVGLDEQWRPLVLVTRSGGRGPAAARNRGVGAAVGDWVVFVDDDVVVTDTWLADLDHDLRTAAADVAGITGKITVPLPSGRRPTDWERNTAGLADAQWITADMAYRRDVLDDVGGFDERFPRAFREDSDLALRVAERYRLVRGTRRTVHPVRSARWNASLTQQRGNADDALMRRLHGPGWHRRAGAPTGRRPLHLLTTGSAAGAVLAALAGRRRTALRCGLAWAGLTAQFAWARIRPGPRTPDEVTRMLVTSALIPPAATLHWVRGLLATRGAAPWRRPTPPIEAVLFDRDGTLVHDVPYNGKPELVTPVPDAQPALRRLREAGVRIAVITNQSGIARGLLDTGAVRSVNARVDELLGPFDDWQVCPHDDTDGCSCRKPAPGMVHAAARALGVPVERCAVIGDTAADVAAGTQAGAAISVLVPNGVTRPEEVDAAADTAATLSAAVDRLFADFTLGTVPA